MAEINQQTFLGASVRNFNASLGWGGSPSTLNVGLVEDDVNNDSFTEPQVGSKVSFNFVDWNYDGILSTYQKKYDASGNPVIEVNITDPRTFLDGVQLIIGGYSGQIAGIPNLYNIYGYLESIAFGNAAVNEAGMSWLLIKNSLLTMISSNPLLFAGEQYLIDLSGLPNISSEYRIPGNSITLLGFIQDICETGGHDFFVELMGNVIYVRTVSRTYQPTLGSIERFIETTSGVVSKEHGYELEYNTTCKFLVGGQVESMYYQFFSNNGDDSNNNDEDNNIVKETEEDDEDRTDDTIWPYFGLNYDGTPYFISSIKDDGYFTASGLPISFTGRDWSDGYPIDVQEMRAAADSQESWENFIIANDYPESIHYNKAARLGLVGSVRNDIYNFLISGKTATEVKDSITNMLSIMLTAGMETDLKTLADEDYIKLVYEYVRIFAVDFYGRRFMVRIPNVSAKLVPETNTIITSMEPTESGYAEDALIARAVNDNMAPNDIFFITNEQNKIVPYVRFSRYQDNKYLGQHVNLSKLSESDYVIGADGLSVFVKCSVEPGILFLDRNTLSSPRVIITLPGPVYYGGSVPGEFGEYSITDSSLRHFIAKKLIELGETAESAAEYTARLFETVGSDALFGGMSGVARLPDMAAIPLKSNVETYGPWYAVGANGKIEFTQNETLVPWNFGSIANLDLAGAAAVNEAIASRQISESGSIEVPGTPSIRLGGQLITAGPYVTDIQVNVGTEGVTTTYRMNSWQVKPGKALRSVFEKIQSTSKLLQEQKRLMRTAYQSRRPILKDGNFFIYSEKVNRKKPTSTHQIIVAETVKDSSGFSKSAVGSVPFYHFKNSIFRSEDYHRKAGASLDAIFRPFSTDVNSSGIAKFEKIAKRSFEETPVVNNSSLNPFRQGHDINLLVKGTGLTDLLNEDSGDGWDVRSLAFKTPMVLTGYGYDRYGMPVPSSYVDGTQDEDYLRKSDSWKTGCFDARWDDKRKVWVGGDFITRVLIEGSILPGSSGVGIIKTLGGNQNVYVWDEHAKNCLLGEHVMCFKDLDGFYKPIGSQGLTRPALSSQTIIPGGSGTFSVRGGERGATISTSIVGSTSWLISTSATSGISNNQECVLSYFGNGTIAATHNGWQVIAARCES